MNALNLLNKLTRIKKEKQEVNDTIIMLQNIYKQLEYESSQLEIQLESIKIEPSKF